MSTIDIIAECERIGREYADDALSAGCEIAECSDIPEEAVQEIRAALRAAGDDRADMYSLGYRSEGRDLMRAYARGWDSRL